MNGGGSNEEKSADKLMDDHLKSLGLQRKRIAKDGSCLFRAVAEQVLHCQNLHTKVRAQCAEFLKKNRELYEAFIEGDFKDYLDKLKDPQQWVGEVEINALAVLYRRDFLIYQEPGKSPVNITDNNFTDTVQLCFLNGNHYDSVYPIDHIKNSALCQSILYELLYEKVFKVDYSLLGTVQRVPRSSDLLIDDNMATCGTSDESDLDVGEGLRAENESTAPRHNRGRGRGRHFPERVRRSLNPTLYRNIEYDVWLKSKKAQQRMDYCIAAGMQFTAGDRCQVCLEGSGRSYSATVKEVPPNNGLVTVYIEELGRKQVPLWSLRPPTSEEKSWSTVVNRDKRLSDGHRDWEERGKGRGRGKHIPPAKQHSWPPEASLMRQGAVNSNRFLSSVEAPVGLEKEHLANQEELRNVTPLEILLGDEHSFPALGDDGGRRKGADRRRSQGIKTKSPGDDSRDPPPSVGETPKSSTPPSADYPPPTSASAKPPTDPFPLQDSAANMKTPPTCPASATKTDTPSYATAATPITSPAAADAPSSTKLSFPCGAVPSTTVYLTPVLPTAAFSPLPNTLSSSSPPPPSSLANFLPSSFLPKSSPSPPSSSSPTLPTFIAPIAPHPSSRPHSPCLSPSLSSVTSTSFSLIRHAVGVQKVPTSTPHSLTNVGGSHTFQNSLSQTQITSDSQTHFIPVPHVVSAPNIQPQFLSQSQSEVPVVQSSHHTLETSCPGPSQPRSSVAHPHPFQIPHSSLSLSASLTPNNQTEDPPSHTAPQLHLPHPQSIPGAVPLQQMSQLYQDPLYPGFPLGEKGDIASIPSFSSSKMGDDLPNDINILRFFFNLGIKAYSMPMFSPYIYLLPLQQAHTMQLKLNSQSLLPPPHFPPSHPATRHQDGYPQLQYLPTSASVSSQHEPPPTSEAMYPVTDSPAPRLPWQQQQMPPHRNPTYPGTYPTPYPHPQILSQGYQLYPSSVPGYPPPLLGYQTSSGQEGGPRGAIEPHDPGSSISNSNNKMSAPGLAHRNQQGDSLTRSLLLVNPPHNNPILVSMPGVNHVPVSMTMMRTNNSPGSPSCSDFISNTSSPDDHFSQGYHGHQSPTNTYVSPASSQVGHSLGGAALPSVGCNTEDDWTGVKPPAYNHIGQRRSRRGRGGYDPGRGSNRRYVGETGLTYVQYNRGRRY